MLPPTPPISGLTHAEANARRITESIIWRLWARVATYGSIVFIHLVTTLNVVILSLAVTLLSLGNVRDAVATSIVVILNVSVSTVQSIRARIALDRIRAAHVAPVMVWRDAQLCAVDPTTVVVGDIVLILPGDVIVADGVIIAADACDIDEAILTGESEPIRRRAGDHLPSGATCVAGAAWYQVTTIEGVLARLTYQAQQMRHISTPLVREVNRVIRLIVAITVMLLVVVGLRAWWLGLSAFEYVPHLTVMAGLIPNALVLMLTISYALGALVMTRHGGLVQQLAAVESLSHVDAICFDKTGTLTANRLVVAELRAIAVSPPEFMDALGRFVTADGAANRTARAIATVVSAPPEHELASVPFDSARKWSMRVTPSGVWILGAPDIIQPHLGSDWQSPLAADASANGARVVLLAHAPCDAVDVTTIADHPQLPDACVPYGVAVLVDEMRESVDDVIAQFARAGVDVYVLSGDDPVAVAHIARRAGISSATHVHGQQLDDLDDDALERMLLQARVFGRVTPLHKQRIVAALQRIGRRVAMVGDGINDVYALKQADVAVAMQSGSAVTRQISDVVLLNDHVVALQQMVVVGRQIYQRMNVVLNHFLFRVVISALVLAVGLLFGQIVWSPIDSTLLALIGVALPAILIVTIPHLDLPSALSSRPQLWRDARIVGGAMILITIVVLMVLPAHAPVILLVCSIVAIWGRLLLHLFRSRRVNMHQITTK